MITANQLLVWFVEGFFAGLGFWLAAALFYWPTRRFWGP